jgi:hypothetical protein
MNKSKNISRAIRYPNEHPVTRKIMILQDEVNEHLAKQNHNLGDEYELIKNKQSKLPSKLRIYVQLYCEQYLKDNNDEETNTSTD